MMLAQLILTHRALHYDDKVLQVNDFIGAMTGWPADPKIQPHPFAKLLRHCLIVPRYCKRKSKEAITPIIFWITQHILHSLFKLVKCVFKLTLAAFEGAKLAFRSLSQRLKHLHFKNSNSLLRDPESGVNRSSERTDNGMLYEGVSGVDRAVDNYISSLAKTFAIQFHQSAFRIDIEEWKSRTYVCSSLIDTYKAWLTLVLGIELRI